MRLAKIDKFYTAKNNDLNHKTYSIHGHFVGLDHSLVQLHICIGDEIVRKSSFKWNIIHLKGTLHMN